MQHLQFGKTKVFILFLNSLFLYSTLCWVSILDISNAFVVSVWAASGCSANSSLSQQWCQPVMQAASLNVSHVLLWAEVKYHLSLKTLCTDMYWQVDTEVYMCCKCAAGLQSLQPADMLLRSLLHCLHIHSLYKVGPNFYMYL